MTEKDKEFCRLCAVLKSKTELVNLLNENETRHTIMEKLKKFNINTELSICDSTQPCEVCLTCIDSLNNAFEFVCNVEKAQKIIEGIKSNLNVLIEEFNLTDVEEDCVLPSNESDDDVETTSETSIVSGKKQNNLKSKREKVIKNIDVSTPSQVKQTWRDYDWQCAYCESLFPNIDELKAHSVKFHGCCNPYRCTDCNIRKLKLDPFLTHVRRHKKYLKLSCHVCYMSFCKITQARLHYKCHITTKHVCSGCNESFKSLDELKKHSSAYHRDLRARPLPPQAKQNLYESLTCYICQKTFKNKSTLATHLLTHTDRKREYTCEKCGKRFLSKQNLSGHMMLHDDVRPYPCEICKSRFRTPGQLKAHVGIHDGVKPFECEECGRCFRLKKQLMNHSIIHTNTLPFVCSYCSKSFRFRNILKQHIRQHTGVKPYSCPQCERQFTNWPNYNKHMKRRHGTNMAKRKRTSKGVYPIDPTTGEMVEYEESNKTDEWKKDLLERPRKRGRPKLNNDENMTAKCTN